MLMKLHLARIKSQYTSSPFLFTGYALYFFYLQFTAQTVTSDNVARDRYPTKDFKASRMGHSVKASLWCDSLLNNTRFRFLYI